MASPSLPLPQRRHEAGDPPSSSHFRVQQALTRPRRRRVARRRRFRYRKQAKCCLVVSLLVLSVGAYLVMVAQITQSMANKDGSQSPESPVTQAVIDNTYTSLVVRCLGLATKILGMLLAVQIAITQRRTRVSSLSSSLPRIALPPISLWIDACYAFLRWCTEGTTRHHYEVQLGHSGTTNYTNPTMTVAETLEAFNRERSARGEPTVSSESIAAYERFLRDLASSVVIADSTTAVASRDAPRFHGISKAQLEALCPRWTMDVRKESEDSLGDEPCSRSCSDRCLYQNECGICLEVLGEISRAVEDDGNGNRRFGDTETAMLRTLPCRHTFHSHCIDQWLERSMACPTCKRSVLSPSPPLFRSNISNDRISDESINARVV